MIDWNTVFLTLGGTAALLGVGGFLAKQAVEHTLKIHSERLLEQYKAFIHESARREGDLFDSQSEALKVSLALIYRARNAAKGLLVGSASSDGSQIRSGLRTLDANHRVLSELLFEHRAVLPNDVFALLHECKHMLHNIQANLEYVSLSRRQRSQDLIDVKMKDVRSSVQLLDAHYVQLVAAVHHKLGVQ